MKALHIFFFILLFTTPLHAEQALVLTEIERIQEKIWYLQKDLVEQKTSLKEQQKQLGLFVKTSEQSQVDTNERLAKQSEFVKAQMEEIKQALDKMETLTVSLASQADQLDMQDDTILEQAEKIRTLEGKIQKFQTELSEQQANTSQALAEASKQLAETRLKIDTLGKDVGGQVEQISLWGIGAVLILAVMVTFIIVSRKDKKH